MAGRNEEYVRCSFCNKSQAQVRKLIAGPDGAFICDECIEVCTEILEEELEYEESGNPFDGITLFIIIIKGSRRRRIWA